MVVLVVAVVVVAVVVATVVVEDKVEVAVVVGSTTSIPKRTFELRRFGQVGVAASVTNMVSL